MPVIYLRHHDVYARILALDTEAGGRIEAYDREALGDFVQHRGFWVDLHGWVIGVFASPEGPILFRDDDVRIPLNEAALEWSEGRLRNRFTARWGEHEVDLSYPKAEVLGAHAWDDEEMNDFFMWLYNGMTAGKLREFYVVEF